jgi:glycosyltransferase involved in cell wall biosynthesis
LLIVPWLTLGGADKFNLDLVARLTTAGWEITIATTLTGDHAWLPEFQRHTPDVFVLSHFLRLPDYPRFLRYLIQSRDVDAVLVSHSELGYGLLPYLRAHAPDVAFLDYCHIEEEYWKSGGYPRLAVEFQSALDLNVVASMHLRNWMVGRGAAAERIEVCHINVDADYWQPDQQARARVRADLNVGLDAPVVLFAGRLAPQKQPRVLAETARRLCREQADLVVLVAGDGPDLSWLRGFVDAHRLEAQVRLLGAVGPNRVRELLSAADIFFLPSQWEGIALSLYEALACAVPVVAADVGGQRELVTPDCGVLIARSDEAREVDEYSRVLKALLADPSHCRSMGERGRSRIVDRFRIEQMVEGMERAISTARGLASSRPRPQVPLDVGRRVAFLSVESVRLFQLADHLWIQHYGRDNVRERKESRKTSFLPRLIAWLKRIVRWSPNRLEPSS